MLRDEFVSVQRAASREDLHARITGFTQRLGFQLVAAGKVIDHFGADSEFIVIDNTPADYQALFNNTQRSRACPVMQHCKRHSVPILWNQSTYTAVGRGAQWEEQAAFGYRCGIALAFHLPEGRHFFIGVDRDRPLPDCPGELSRMTADLQLFAVHAAEAAARLLVPAPPREREVMNLTPRELECLRWTMEGKTAWELGRILGISEQTAVRHVNNAMHKLGCVNKYQAVLKALRLKLIR